MIIKTRVKYLRNALENTVFFRGELYDEDLSPAERLYITTDKPASEMSIEELTQLIEEKKEQAIVRKALAQYYEAIDILRAFGAEIESEVIGLEKLKWLQDKGE